MNQIKKEDYSSLKVIALIMMVLLHTFAFKDRLNGHNYISFFPKVNGKEIEYYIAQSSRICVGIFVLLTGYSLSLKKYKILEKYKKFYFNYLIIFFIFIPIGYYQKFYTFEIKEFILNILGIKPTYNGEWWYIREYLLLLLTYPILKKQNKNFIYLCFILSIAGLGISKYLKHINIIIYILAQYLTYLYLFVLE